MSRKPKLIILNARVPIELKQRLDEFCKARGVKKSWLIARAIEEYLERHAGG